MTEYVQRLRKIGRMRCGSRSVLQLVLRLVEVLGYLHERVDGPVYLEPWLNYTDRSCLGVRRV